MPNQIVILSGHSIFSEGVASRLRQYPERVDVRFVDSQQPDYLEQIKAIRPVAVIIDAADTESMQCCLLCDLLVTLVNVTVIRLELQHQDIQVVTSSRHPLTEVIDIINIIEQAPQMLGS